MIMWRWQPTLKSELRYHQLRCTMIWCPPIFPQSIDTDSFTIAVDSIEDMILEQQPYYDTKYWWRCRTTKMGGNMKLLIPKLVQVISQWFLRAEHFQHDGDDTVSHQCSTIAHKLQRRIQYSGVADQLVITQEVDSWLAVKLNDLMKINIWELSTQLFKWHGVKNWNWVISSQEEEPSSNCASSCMNEFLTDLTFSRVFMLLLEIDESSKMLYLINNYADFFPVIYFALSWSAELSNV